ncbi:tetratricopeptide repeat protein [bacterium]|nr:tetratricopeptide repeat protein [bacterium]
MCLLHLGNVEPVAGFSEPRIGCTVALERVQLGRINESNKAMELRLKILAATERWEKLQWLAQGLTVSTTGWASPWFYLAMGKAKTGHVQEAKEAIRKLIDLDPAWRLKVLEDPAFEVVW